MKSFILSFLMLLVSQYSHATMSCKYLVEADADVQSKDDLKPSIIQGSCSVPMCVAQFYCEENGASFIGTAVCEAVKGANGKWKCPSAKTCQDDEHDQMSKPNEGLPSVSEIGASPSTSKPKVGVQ